MSEFLAIIKTMRPPFLLLVLSCLSMSIGFACYLQLPLSATVVSLVIVCGLSAHIAVNMLNEYVDCISRLDFSTHKTPFSGGSGALVNQPETANAVKFTGLLFVGITIAAGLWVLPYTSAWPSLLMMGVAGVIIILTYTPVLNRIPWLCLIAPGLGFGVFMTYGSFVVISGQHHLAMFMLALVPTLLSNNLLLINQFPDANVDATHGRNHVVIQYGYTFCARIYLIQWALTLVLIVTCVVGLNLPWRTLLSLLPLILGWRVYQRALYYESADRSFQTAMGLNVLITLTCPLIIGVTLCVAA